MIEFVLEYCAGKVWDAEGFFLHLFVEILEFDLLVSCNIATFRFWEREATFFYLAKGFLWGFKNLRVDHEDCWELFIFPIREETHDHESFCNSYLGSSQTYSCMVRVLDIAEHLTSKLYILFPFTLLYLVANCPKNRIVFSCFNFEHRAERVFEIYCLLYLKYKRFNRNNIVFCQ